jgi:hypothetical protein
MVPALLLRGELLSGCTIPAMDAVVAALITAVVGGPLVYLLGNRRLRYERLYERRAEVIAKLSELLFEMQRSLLQWTSPFQSSNADRDEQRRKAGEALDELIAYYRSSSVWLEPRTCEKIESFLNTTQDAVYKYLDELNERGHPQNKAGRDASLQLQSELPALRKELEGAFRAILYPALVRCPAATACTPSDTEPQDRPARNRKAGRGERLRYDTS